MIVYFCPGAIQSVSGLSVVKGKLLWVEGHSCPGGNRRGCNASASRQTRTGKPGSEGRGRPMDRGRHIGALGGYVPRTSCPMTPELTWGFGLGFSRWYECIQGTLIQIISRNAFNLLVNVLILSKRQWEVRVGCILSLDWFISPLRRIHHILGRGTSPPASHSQHVLMARQNEELLKK